MSEKTVWPTKMAFPTEGIAVYVESLEVIKISVCSVSAKR